MQSTLLCLEAWAGESRRESSNRTQPHEAGDGGTPGKVIAFHELCLSMSSLPPSFLLTFLKIFPFHIEVVFVFFFLSFATSIPPIGTLNLETLSQLVGAATSLP